MSETKVSWFSRGPDIDFAIKYTNWFSDITWRAWCNAAKKMCFYLFIDDNYHRPVFYGYLPEVIDIHNINHIPVWSWMQYLLNTDSLLKMYFTRIQGDISMRKSIVILPSAYKRFVIFKYIHIVKYCWHIAPNTLHIFYLQKQERNTCSQKNNFSAEMPCFENIFVFKMERYYIAMQQ